MEGTPLQQAVEGYLAHNRSRLHMPGHKGQDIGCGFSTPYDITEVQGTDSLYFAQGAILACEQAYSTLYGTQHSLLSAGGSTLCIQAMLTLAAQRGRGVLCPRMLHSSAVSAMALLGLEPTWLKPQIYSGTQYLQGLILPPTPQQIEDALSMHRDLSSVYITSPDYFGQMADIAAIAKICHRHGALLLVDNAHGSHLKFLQQDTHPMTLGADLCCDSLHKTLPVYTGGALLHIAHGVEDISRQNAKAAMALFGSTSPSYPILLSIDRCLAVLGSSFAPDAQALCTRLAALGRLAVEQGFTLSAAHLQDPMRLTLGFAALGFTDDAFIAHLHHHGIEPEYAQGGTVVLLASPYNPEEDFIRLEAMLRAAPLVATSPPAPCPTGLASYLPPALLSMREAVLAPCESIPLAQTALGKICARPVSVCPPGIPLLMPGEAVTAKILEILKNCGISHINVVK